MLWDDGKVGGSLDNPAQWNQLAQLLEVGKQAVYDASIAAPVFGSPWENLSLFDNRGEALRGRGALGGTISGTQTETSDRAEPAVPELFPTQFIDKITIRNAEDFPVRPP